MQTNEGKMRALFSSIFTDYSNIDVVTAFHSCHVDNKLLKCLEIKK